MTSIEISNTAPRSNDSFGHHLEASAAGPLSVFWHRTNWLDESVRQQVVLVLIMESSIVNSIRLAPGEPSDLPMICQHEQAYITEFEPHNLQAWQAAIHRHLEQWMRCLPRTVVAAAGNETIGYFFWEREARIATLASIHVRSDHRRRAVGRLLLGRFEKDAARLDCEIAELHVIDGNPARHFYETAGYRVSGYAAPYTLLLKELGIASDRP